MCINKNEVNNYSVLNRYAKNNATVIIGSSYMHDVPVAELKQTFEINCNVYNRSLTDLTIAEAGEIVSEVIETLNPNKILLQLGEIELGGSSVGVDSLVNQMTELVDLVKSHGVSLVLVSIANPDESNRVTEFNRAIEKLAARSNCQFADIKISDSMEDAFHINAFRKLRFFLLDEMSLADSLILV